MTTNDLRKLIQSELKKITGQVYYQLADENAMYPHIVTFLETMTMLETDLHRHNYQLYVDVWSKDVADAEDLADLIEDKFNALNVPQETILPTFYLDSRRSVIDEDKTIIHRQLVFIIHNYERN